MKKKSAGGFQNVALVSIGRFGFRKKIDKFNVQIELKREAERTSRSRADLILRTQQETRMK